MIDSDDRTAICIRPETAADHDAIRRVVTEAFGSAVEADLVDRIRASPEYVAATALVAELDGEPDPQVVGHVMVSGAVIRNDGGERAVVMLAPLAVAPAHRKQGIGGALVHAVTAIADGRGEPLVVLEGSPTYYSRFGFEHSSTYGITIHLPDWAPPEAAQVLRLSAYDASDPALRGQVVYPPAFDGLD